MTVFDLAYHKKSELVTTVNLPKGLRSTKLVIKIIENTKILNDNIYSVHNCDMFRKNDFHHQATKLE